MANCIACKVEGKRKKAEHGKYCFHHYDEFKAKKRATTIPLRDYWYSIVGRCTKEHWTLYSTYGAKGYTVCEAWLDKKTFVSWSVSQGYRRGMILKFKVEDCKVYSPDNCYFEEK